MSHAQRILVAGASGAGKSTLAADISAKLGIPYTEIDSLFHGPNWEPREDFVFAGGWLARNCGTATAKARSGLCSPTTSTLFGGPGKPDTICGTCPNTCRAITRSWR